MAHRPLGGRRQLHKWSRLREMAVDANGNTFALPRPAPGSPLSLLKAGVWLEGPARMGLSLQPVGSAGSPSNVSLSSDSTLLTG